MAWGDKDKKCPYCNQITEVARGANKQNLRRLLFSKPTMQEWMVLFTIVMVLLVAWRYNVEVDACHELVDNPQEVCTIWYNNMVIGESSGDPYKKINTSTFLDTTDNEK